MVGHLGVDELAAVGIASTVLNTVLGLLVFLAYATTPAVARLLGTGHRSGPARGGVDGIWLAIMLGTVLAIAGPFVAGPVTAAFGAEDRVTALATQSLAISSMGAPAMLVVM